MPQSFGVYGGQGVYSQPFSTTIPLGKRIFDLYPSLGDVAYSTTFNVATAVDGPMQVLRYNTLTLNSGGIITTTNRCRGLLILANTITLNSGGGVTMTGKGARGTGRPNTLNATLPDAMTFTSAGPSLAQILAFFTSTGYFPGDPYLWLDNPAGLSGVIASNYGAIVTLMTATGCGAANDWCLTASAAYHAGLTGKAGTAGPGGGGNGGDYNGYQYPGGSAWLFGGGAGAGGAHAATVPPNQSSILMPESMGGRGGDTPTPANSGSGAGNPPGSGGSAANTGVGGIVWLVALSGLVINTGAVIQADGMPGINGGNQGGGGSGGGVVALVGTVSGTAGVTSATVHANGGLGGTSTTGGPGGPGGAGVVIQKTLAQMGAAWA